MRVHRGIDTRGIEIELDALEGRLDLVELFGNERPVEFEIGSGKGTFMVQESGARPQTNFLGLEYIPKYQAYMADRLRRHGRANARTACADAVEFVRERVPDRAFAVVHIYVPDPWPKKRHQKRRIVRPDFLPELQRIVAPGGELRIVTDHPEYAEWIEEVLGASSFERVEYTPPESAREGELVGTNFERKYIVRDGRPFHPFALRRAR
jgi:tRNA (guanine-N7-)-methyltransferase